MTTNDDNWECTDETQQNFIKLYSTNKKQWKTNVTKMIRDHPSKFSILTVGQDDTDGDNLYTFDEFSSHFEQTITNNKLLKLIYDDIDHYDNAHIKLVAIITWVNDVKKQKETQILKDHKWLFTKILHVQAVHLDADGSGEVDREEFVNYFVNKIGFPSEVANAIFNDIDVNNDGDLSIMEYTKWKSKHNKPDKLKRFLDKIEKQIENKKVVQAETKENDDKKCQQCDGLKKEINQLNDKHKSIELKLKSVNSKHNNLLADYEKISKLLAEGKAKDNSSKAKGKNGNDKATKQKIDSLQRENKKLIDESKIRTAAISNCKGKNITLEKQIRKLTRNNEELKNENGNDKEATNQKMDALQNENKKLNNENKNCKTEVDNIQEQNKNLQKKIKKLNGEMEELKNDNSTLMQSKISSKDIKEKLSKLEMNIKLKNEEIDTLKSENDTLKNAANDDSNKGNNKLKMYKMENEELNDKIDEQNKKIKDFKKQTNSMEEENDELKIEINTKKEEIKLLKDRINLNKSSDDEKVKQMKEDNEQLDFQVEKYKKEIKRLKAEIEEGEENIDKVEKEKRKIKAELNKKDGEITILVHKLELTEQSKELSSGTETDQIRKLKTTNLELDDENMKQQLTIKNLKEQINNLSEDIEREKEHFHKLQIELNKEKSSTENYIKLQDIEANKLNEKDTEINQLMDERQTFKHEIIELNALLDKHNIEKEKISQEKQALLQKVEKEKNNATALMAQFDQMENKTSKSVDTVQAELHNLKNEYDKLQNKYDENETKQNETMLTKDEEIKKLSNQNANLTKKVQNEKNNLDAVLKEIRDLETKQDEEQKNQVSKQCIKMKHDLSKLNIQIEILNSDTFRMKTLLLLSKYERVDKKKYYGFLDFAAKDLSDKALNNVYKKLHVTDRISATALAPLLGVIVKLYKIRLNKLKTGKNNTNKIDRRVIEHLGVWIIRQHSKKTNKSETITILNDNNQNIKGTYAVYDGYVLKREMATLFSSWCEEYVECQGRHDDSRLQ